MNLRKLARGKDCMLRIPACCDQNPETTVLAHIKRGWYGSLKPHDVIAVWACHNCHSVIDGRERSHYTRVELDSIILRALCQQLEWYVENEIVKW